MRPRAQFKIRRMMAVIAAFAVVFALIRFIAGFPTAASKDAAELSVVLLTVGLFIGTPYLVILAWTKLTDLLD